MIHFRVGSTCAHPSLFRQEDIQAGSARGGRPLVATFLVSPAEAQNRFWLVNGTGMQINEAYVSPSRLSEWGPDILGAGVLPAGQQVWVTPNFGDCVLDVRVRY